MKSLNSSLINHGGYSPLTSDVEETIQSSTEKPESIPNNNSESSLFPNTNTIINSTEKLEITSNNNSVSNLFSNPSSNVNNQNSPSTILSEELKKSFFQQFKLNVEELQQPVPLTIGKSEFEAIKNHYIDCIEKKDIKVHKKLRLDTEKYIENLRNFNFELDGSIILIKYPAYSKDKSCGYNTSGDTSLEIKLPNGDKVSFVFDARSTALTWIDNTLVNCFDEMVLFDGDKFIAMHANLLFLLHICSGKDFVRALDSKPDLYKSVNPLEYIKDYSPYAWVRSTPEKNIFYAMYDCNILCRIGDREFFMLSCGLLMKSDAQTEEECILKYEELYQQINFKIDNIEILEKLAEYSRDYAARSKSMRNAGVFFKQPVEIPKNMLEENIILAPVTDGITDNPKVLALLDELKSQGKSPNEIFQAIVPAMSNPEMVAKPDDVAWTLFVE